MADLTTLLSKFLTDLYAGVFGSTVPITALTVTKAGIATTSTVGETLTNTTAATGGATVQMSPSLKWRGTAWDTAASETVDFFAEVLPATAATPTGTWKLGYSLNGAAASYPFIVASNGSVTATNYIMSAAGLAFWTTRAVLESQADGMISIENNAQTIGVRLKADALPTVASGFGTSPTVTAGSTPFAGSVNVGTGGVATSGIINFNGTAFPSAPFPIVMNQTTGAVCRATASTTQLTITAPAAFTASDVISWICVSAK